MNILGEVNINIYNGRHEVDWSSHHIGTKSHLTLLESITNPQLSGTKNDVDSIDITVRSRTSGKMLMLSSVSIDNDSIILQGFMRIPGLNSDAQIATKVDLNKWSKIKLGQTGHNEVSILDQRGNPTNYRYRSYSVSPGMEGKYLIHSGIAKNAAGEEVEFIINFDAPPVVVIVVVVAIIMGIICVVSQVTIDRATQSAIDACTAIDCGSKVTVKSEPGLTWDGWTPNISCTTRMNVECIKCRESETEE